MKNNINKISHQSCYGCFGCKQVCPTKAISIKVDQEGFSYPLIDEDKCISCGLCLKVCPVLQEIRKLNFKQKAFGGYSLNKNILENSTSGGAFTEIVDKWGSIDNNYVIFGAEATSATEIKHSYITDVKDISRFQKSKYNQSEIGNSYIDVDKFLVEGKRVLFSGTPCQIAGLHLFIGKAYSNLLTVEVICEGFPSPLFIKSYIKSEENKSKDKIISIDYRFKNKNKWDFQYMNIFFKSGKEKVISRWFNPFWSIWLQHLMSRPSCYQCNYACKERNADITLGDLWGVHLYCPELYGKNKGASLVVCNSEKGFNLIKLVQKDIFLQELDFDDVLKYQSPMRKPITKNNKRLEFMNDLTTIDYDSIVKKWNKPTSLKMLFDKYFFGNRQRVKIWQLKRFFRRNKK